MGEQFIEDVSIGVRSVTVSRKRALQLIGGALAIAAPSVASPVPQVAEARKQRKPPEAFAVVTLSDPNAPDENAFRFTFQLPVAHPASKTAAGATETIVAGVKSPADQMRKQPASALMDVTVNQLADKGVTVPRDRISVVLL